MTTRAALRRGVASLLDPWTWLHLLRLVNHASYDHARPRRRIRRGTDVRISPTASFRNGERISLGSRCHVGDRCSLWAGDVSGQIVVGEDALLGPGVFVTASNYLVPHGQPVIGQPHEERDVRIGARTWLGANVVVLPGVQIGDGCVVGAGSVVSRSLPAEAVAVGVPARVVRERRPASSERAADPSKDDGGS